MAVRSDAFIIVHTGAGRQRLFASSVGFRHYLHELDVLRRDYRLRLYGYCLLPNAALICAGAPATGAPRLDIHRWMVRLATRHVVRSWGSAQWPWDVWDNALQITPVATPIAVAHACRWIELTPLRSGLVADPLHWAWSSFQVRVQRRRDCSLDAWPPGGASCAGVPGDPLRYAAWVGEGVGAVQARILANAERAGLLRPD